MSYEPIDALHEVPIPIWGHECVYEITSLKCITCGDPLIQCEESGTHEFSGGRCVDCGFLDEDFDPTPHAGGMSDRADHLSYAGWAWGA